MTYSWRSLLLVVAGVVVALFCADLLMGKVFDAPLKRQVRNGLSDLERVPNVLVISSSHGRSFHILGEVLRERTAGKVDLIAVALEAGKVDAMEWVLDRRVKPLILDSNGEIKEPLTHMMFGITWWDTCRHEVPNTTAHNIVTHGWDESEYVRGFFSDGATELNRNYVRNLWRHMFSQSALVRTRFSISENFGRFTNFLRVMVNGSLAEDEYAVTLGRWNDDIENGYKCYLSDMDMAAMDRFVKFTKTHNLDLTIVLFPLKPDTVTEKGRENTIRPFANQMMEYGNENDVRVVDMTLGILNDQEFMLDLDHVNPAGNIKWSKYGLENDFNFLIDLMSSEDNLIENTAEESSAKESSKGTEQ